MTDPTPRFLTALVASCLCASLSSQSAHVVVPAAAAHVDGNRWMAKLFREGKTARFQVIVAANHVKGLAGSRIHEVALRKDVKASQRYESLRGGEQVRMRVVASWSDVDPARPSIVFSANRGATSTLVFDGIVKLPRVSVDEDRTVASFDPREAPTLPFQTQLVHVAQKSLVLDIAVDAGRAGYAWTWPVDAHAEPVSGVVTKVGAGCWQSQWSPSLHIAKPSLRPGMDIRVDGTTPPQPVAAFLVIGASDRFAFGTVPLPIRLAAPNCDLHVSPDFLEPVQVFQGPDSVHDGWASSRVATPYLPALHGATLFFQHLLLHRVGARVALATGDAAAATMASLPASSGLCLVAADDSSADRGRVFLDQAPVLRLAAR